MMFLSEFMYYLIRLIIFAAVAGFGIFCGKKYRDKKDAAKTADIK